MTEVTSNKIYSTNSKDKIVEVTVPIDGGISSSWSEIERILKNPATNEPILTIQKLYSVSQTLRCKIRLGKRHSIHISDDIEVLLLEAVIIPP